MSAQILANWERFGSGYGEPHGLPNRSIEVEVEVSIDPLVVAPVYSFQDLHLHRSVSNALGLETAEAGIR